jgi:predicted HTH domain antitoxin
MKTVTTRLPEDDEAASEVLRRLIRQGLSEWKRERALEGLRDHSLTLRKAAEVASVSYVELLTLATEEGIDVGYTTDDLQRDLDRI